MVLVTVRHEPGNWLHTFYSPPLDNDPDGRTVAVLSMEHGRHSINLGTGTDASVIAACIELEAAFAELRRQAQEHAAQGWMDPLLPTDVPLAETELRAVWGDR